MVWVTDALSGRVVFSFPLDDMTMKPVFEAIDIDGDGLADLVFTWDSRGLGGGTATVSVLRMKAGTIASFEVYADRNLGTKESFSGDARQKSMKNLRAALKTKWKAVFADWGL